MESEQTEKVDIKSKLKNKKKDYILPTQIGTCTDSTEKQDKAEDIKQPTDGKIKKFSLEFNSINNSNIEKILFNIQLLFAMVNQVDLKLYQALSPFLSKDHLKAILEERDCRSVCGNFFCGKLNIADNKSNKKAFYNPHIHQYTTDDLFAYFCDVRCCQKFKECIKQSENFDYLTILGIDSIFLFSVMQDYYPENLYLKAISHIASNIIEEYIKSNPSIKEELESFCAQKRLQITKLFIDNFEDIIQSPEYKDNLELNALFTSSSVN